MIIGLKPNQIFVFGSNMAGKHMGGAARFAKEKFGAEEGIAEGLTGQCYAFPTLTGELEQRHHLALKESAKNLFNCVVENPEKEFLLTEVGCGIAGFSKFYMMQFFKDFPTNLIKPKGW
jgi:hypothetical protein